MRQILYNVHVEGGKGAKNVVKEQRTVQIKIGRENMGGNKTSF